MHRVTVVFTLLSKITMCEFGGTLESGLCYDAYRLPSPWRKIAKIYSRNLSLNGFVPSCTWFMGLETAPSEGRETVTAVDFAEVVVRCHVDGLTGGGGGGGRGSAAADTLSAS